MLTYHLLPLSPALMRFYRNRILIDLPTLLKFLPSEGRLLDVGCGTGLLDYAIARHRPGLKILGIDIDERAVGLANRYNRRPNLEFAAVPLQDVTGSFDCISFVDVMHHATKDDARGLLESAESLLASGGEILIKDISRKGGWFSYAHDRYITRSKVIRLANMDEMMAMVPERYRVTSRLKKYSVPFPNYYIRLARESQSPVFPMGSQHEQSRG